MATPYEALGVAPTATHAEVVAAYRRLSARNHPDRLGGSDARMAEINAAYETLGDPAKRRRYDETGESGVARPLESLAEELVMQLVDQLAPELFAGRVSAEAFFDVVRGHIDGQAAQLREQMRQAAGARAGLERLQARLRFRAGAGARRDFLAAVFAAKVEKIKRADAQVAERLEVLRLARGFTLAYGLESDQAQARQFGVFLRTAV